MKLNKNDKTVMATAIKEDCIGWLHENSYYVGGQTFGGGSVLRGRGDEQIFGHWGDSTH